MIRSRNQVDAGACSPADGPVGRACGGGGVARPAVAISTDGSVSSSTTRRRLVRIAAFPVPVRERFFLAAAGSAGGRGAEALSRLGGEMRSVEPGAIAEIGTGVSAAAAAGDRSPARTERREPTGHSRQPMSSMSRVAPPAESAAAAAEAAPGGGAVALRGTVERRGRMSSTEPSASTIAGCDRGVSG